MGIYIYIYITYFEYNLKNTICVVLFIQCAHFSHSFSDGNKFLISDPDWVLKAVDCALKMIEEGADILDIGGESTRPGAVPVEEEVLKKKLVCYI